MGKKIEKHEGQEYKPMEYPLYRKLGDQNIYKVVSATEFVNVVVKPELSVAMIGHGQLLPAAVPGFMQQTAEATAEAFNGLFSAVLTKIQSA